MTDVPTGVGGGVSCTVTGGAGATIPANSSAPFDYACTFTSQPNYSGGTNTATATWTRNGGGSASTTAKPVSFGVTNETNLEIHVQDNKTTGSFVDLGTANFFDGPTSFEYDLTFLAGGVGACDAYTNTARIQETNQQAQQTVNVCVPNVTLSKTVAVTRGGTSIGGTGTPVLPGDVLTWTITIANTSTVAYTGALFTDDLTSTVAGATLAGAPDFISSDPSVATTWTAGTNTLTGTATNLAAGASVTVTYSGTVKARAELTAGGVTTIDNTVVPSDDVPNCTTTPGCDTTNPVTPALTLVKKVVDHTGVDITTPALAGRWTLTATGTGGFSGPGNSAAVTGQPVNSGVQYTLSETTVAGYTNGTTWSCTGGGTSVAPDKITLAAGENVTCTITNTEIQPTLTLKKQVRDLDGDVTFSADWTLTATASDSSTPINGKPAVAADGISAPVNSGVTYTLSESGGPAGYTPDAAWTCTGGTFTSPDTIVLAAGENATCAIINTRNLPVADRRQDRQRHLQPHLFVDDRQGRQPDLGHHHARRQRDLPLHGDGDPGAFQDSDWAIFGAITITNPNNVPVPVTVSDVTAGVGGGVACTITGGPTGRSRPTALRPPSTPARSPANRTTPAAPTPER